MLTILKKQKYYSHKRKGYKGTERATHQRLSMYVWRTHTPLPFIPKRCISVLDTAAVPTAIGALQLTRGMVSHFKLNIADFERNLDLCHNALSFDMFGTVWKTLAESGAFV